MSDRLALANVFEEAGIERSKAVRIATLIIDAIRGHVATKADVDAAAATLRTEIAMLRSEITGLRRDLKLI